MSRIFELTTTLLHNLDSDNDIGQETLEKTIHLIENTPYPMISILPLLTTLLPDSDRDRIHAISHYLDNWNGNPYHSSHHHAKVTFVATVLGIHHGLEKDELRNLILTASIHDMDFLIGSKPGEMEKISIDNALSKGFITQDDYPVLLELNMATVFPVYRQGEYQHLSGRDSHVILSDADLSGSGAISFDQYQKETIAVEKEIGIKLDAKARLGFLKMIGPMKSMIETIFESNQEKILKKQEEVYASVEHGSLKLG